MTPQWPLVSEVLFTDKIDNLSKGDITSKEEEAMEKNAWSVAQDDCQRILMEPGPAGDLVLGMVEDFFYNTQYLVQFYMASEIRNRFVPGYHYFQKISTFIKEHQERELYLEYLMGAFRKDGLYDMCAYCLNYNLPQDIVTKAPSLDYSRIPNFSLSSVP